jgi:OOP family OmpA-OmpF porin
MKKTALQILAVSTLAASMASAFAAAPADRTGTFYLSPAVGIYMPDGNRNMNNNFEGSLAFGYNFTNQLAVQAMFSGMSMSPTNTNASTTTAYLFNVDGIVNIPTGTAFVPYLAGGIGTLKMSHPEFEVDTGVGANYYLGQDFAVGVNYRHIDDFNDVLSDNMVNVGVTWVFGGSQSVAVAAAPAPVVKTQGLNAQQQAMMTEAQSTLRDVLPNGVVLCGADATPQQGCVTINGNQMIMHLDVKFANNQAAVAGNYPAAIDRLATFMNTYPQTTVVLYGYASKIGTEAYNQKLSLRRAESVKSYLVGKGIAASRIQTEGKGTQEPIATNATKTGRAKNRRVQADVPVPLQANGTVVSAPAATAPAAPAPVVTAPVAATAPAVTQTAPVKATVNAPVQK